MRSLLHRVRYRPAKRFAQPLTPPLQLRWGHPRVVSAQVVVRSGYDAQG